MVISERGAQEGRIQIRSNAAHHRAPSTTSSGPPAPPSGADPSHKMSQHCGTYAIRRRARRRCPCSAFANVATTPPAVHAPPALKIAKFVAFKTFVIWFALSWLLSSAAAVVAAQRDHPSHASKRYEYETADQQPAAAVAEQNPSHLAACPNCFISRDELRKYTLEEIKHQILVKLGFVHGTPNVTNKVQTNENPFVKQFVNDMGAYGLHSEPVGKSPHRGRHKNYMPTMQNDESPKQYDDDDRIQTPFIVAIAKSCKYSKIYYRELFGSATPGAGSKG